MTPAALPATPVGLGTAPWGTQNQCLAQLCLLSRHEVLLVRSRTQNLSLFFSSQTGFQLFSSKKQVGRYGICFLQSFTGSSLEDKAALRKLNPVQMDKEENGLGATWGCETTAGALGEPQEGAAPPLSPSPRLWGTGEPTLDLAAGIGSERFSLSHSYSRNWIMGK